MRPTFPLTDYDFYAYVLTGVVALGIVDHVFLAGNYIVDRDSWTIPYGVGLVVVSYIAGQLAPMVSALLLERLLVCRLLCPPREYLLGVRTPNRWATLMAKLSTSHYIEPLPDRVIALATQNTARALGEGLGEFRRRLSRSEEVFQYG